MDSNDSASRPAAPRSADPRTGGERPGGAAPKDTAERSRPIPTPGDLFPRGVRREPGEDTELATGTG